MTTTNPIPALDATTARLIAGTNAQLHSRPIPSADDFAPIVRTPRTDRPKRFRSPRRTPARRIIR